jgi:hypothetical protein
LKVLAHEIGKMHGPFKMSKYFTFLFFVDDEWERFTINFSIYFPVKPNEIMRINGDIEEMGNWNKGDGAKSM